jgi:hypothetical protein
MSTRASRNAKDRKAVRAGLPPPYHLAIPNLRSASARSQSPPLRAMKQDEEKRDDEQETHRPYLLQSFSFSSSSTCSSAPNAMTPRPSAEHASALAAGEPSGKVII